MKMSACQNTAYEMIMKFINNDEKRFVLSGYAGTGKTTLAKYLAGQCGKVGFAAYTGKAANVLREKGCKGANTIHGSIYTYLDDDKFGRPQFVLDQDSAIKKCDLVIVDEYSMLDENIIKDLESLATKVLYLGDDFQLPPIEGECVLQPDFVMTEVHRQALESPILRAATAIREGKDLPHGSWEKNGDAFTYQPRSKADPEWFFNSDQIIVGYNKTRLAWNEKYRKRLGYEGDLPVTGDKMICLQNNHEIQIYNGMISKCEEDSEEAFEDQTLYLEIPDYPTLKIWDGDIRGRDGYPPKELGKIDRFDFGYAITCHKAQGSEYDSVCILKQPIGKDKETRRKWLYTAITRAKQTCYLVEK